MVSFMIQNFTLEPFLEPVPPHLSRLFGYKGAWRWVAFYWNKAEKGPRFPVHFDGHATGPVNLTAWEAFFNHRLVLAYNHRREDGYAIKRFEFGGERSPANHWLLLDRQKRCLYAGPESEVAKFVSIFMDQLPDHGSAENGDRSEKEPSSRKKKFDHQESVESLSDMIKWLDHRVAALESSGRWPVFGD